MAILECGRAAFRQRVARARRTLRYVIDNRCGLVDPGNPCRCGRDGWIEPVARQLDEIEAIGELYRFDRFTAPERLWDDLQRRYPQLPGTG